MMAKIIRVKKIEDIPWKLRHTAPKHERWCVGWPVEDDAPFEYFKVTTRKPFDDKKYKKWCYLDEFIQTDIEENKSSKNL